MKVLLVFVPPGGGEQDYSLDFELPGTPQTGDYILISRPGSEGRTEDFIVRRTWWHLEYPDNATMRTGDASIYGQSKKLVVECEFALGGWSSEEHKRSCEMYKARGKDVKKFDVSGY